MLKDHMLEDRLIYGHAYRVGDVAIWDTSRTLHSATPIAVTTGEVDSGLLHRISIRGRPRVCH